VAVCSFLLYSSFVYLRCISMGVGRQDLAEPRVGRRRVRATLSLSAGKARTPSGASRAGAVTTVPIVTLSAAQIAEIKG
jgi:hypothetical protein